MPPPPGGYQGATPPPPGQSGDLPPGYLSRDQRAVAKVRQRRRGRLMLLVGALVVVVGVVATLAMQSSNNQPDTLADVEVGECFTGDASDLEVVECAQPHDGELFALVPAAQPGGAFPGDDALLAQAGPACVTQLTTYFGAGPEVAVANNIEIQPVTPTEAQWSDGTTDSTCVAVAANGQQAQGSIQGQGA
jgi:hypothetical protein